MHRRLTLESPAPGWKEASEGSRESTFTHARAAPRPPAACYSNDLKGNHVCITNSMQVSTYVKRVVCSK